MSDGQDIDLTEILQRSLDLAKATRPRAVVVPIVPESDLSAACCAVERLRCIDKDGHENFEPWCCVHHHWLNGAKAQTVYEREVAYFKSLEHKES